MNIQELVQVAAQNAFTLKTPEKKGQKGTAVYTCHPKRVVEMADGITNVAAKRALQNLVRKLTSRNINFGYGTRMGTPPKGKTKQRMTIQKHFGMTEFAKRLSSGGHPTKTHTPGRMEKFA